VLDGPVLGVLPPEIKQALQDISAHSQDRLTAYVEAQQREGKDADPAQLAKLRLQTRAELQRLLSPTQLEEYLLRYSQDASNLRFELGQLRFFNTTPEEFRTIFRATDVFDQQIELLAGNDPATVQQRKALEDQRENAIRINLGPERYEEYRALHDPMYRDAVALAQQAGMPDAARAIYDINQAAAAEQESIRANTNLTSTQKSIELKRLELEQLQANAVATDQELPAEPPAQPQPAPKKVFIVGPGDNAATVATIYGVPVAALRDANPDVNLNRLKPGDVLNIPRNPLAPSPSP
jgi:LysM repeat protein